MHKEKNNDTSNPRQPSPKKKAFSFLRNETLHFVVGLMLVIFSVYLLLAFSSFFFTGAADQSIIETADPDTLMSTDNGIQNYAGSRGAQLASYLINDCFGLASFFIVIFLALAGFKLMRVRAIRLWKCFVVCALLLVWFSIFLGFAFVELYSRSFFYWGGKVGDNVSRWLVSQVGVPGVWLILLATAICLLTYISTRTIVGIRHLLTFGYLKRKKKAEPAVVSPAEEPIEQSQSPAEANQPIENNQPTGEPDEQPAEEELPNPEEESPDASPTDDGNHEVKMTIETPPDEELEDPVADEPAQEPTFEVEANEDDTIEGEPLQPYNPRLDLENYRFPTIDLMKQFDDDGPNVDMDEQTANKDRIVSTLHSFGIEIASIKATVGPTVTLYEVVPEEGIRIAKIRNLEDDIALSLKAQGIRIIAPIPGKGTIGIEVPNSNPRIVSGRSIIGSRKFQETNYALPIALGKTITNEVFMVALEKMPHVLVAGATGQGKSVGLNAIITSLLYKKHPAELKFVLIDPKKVEFSIYSAIEQHFLAKLPDDGDAIITDVTKVVQTLNSLCLEMDTRYDLLKAAHVRNVQEYNEKFIARRLNPEKGHRYMPYIVVIIDEFGDLIMTAGKDIELPIARIAQLARAVGIHMIIATQRPTTNIITGTIKANFPARIAFRVSQMVDSRTILDRPGANQLIGRGDMLFLQGGEPVRVQCAFIDTPEVERITNFIASQQGYPTPFYLPECPDENGGDSGLDEVDLGRLDSLFEEAARLVVVHQQGSTSLIQRKFSIGYNRAGRIMDQLEKAGIVGPIQGSKPRDVLCVDELDLENRLQNLR